MKEVTDISRESSMWSKSLFDIRMMASWDVRTDAEKNMNSEA